MNIMLVTPKQLPGPSHVQIGPHDLWLRSALSGLISLPVDILVHAPGISREQALLSAEKTRPTLGKIYKLVEVSHEDLR
jgi:hypothetical protein